LRQATIVHGEVTGASGIFGAGGHVQVKPVKSIKPLIEVIGRGPICPFGFEMYAVIGGHQLSVGQKSLPVASKPSLNGGCPLLDGV
jgi:hypothetical protein